MMEHKKQQPSRMVASGDDPWISVSDLGEFAFCPRAGLIASEKAAEDMGDEDPRPQRRKFYSIGALKREIERRQQMIVIQLVVGGILLIVLAGIWLAQGEEGFMPLMIIGGGSAFAYLGMLQVKPDWSLIHCIARLFEAQADLAKALNAAASVPPPDHKRAMTVDWWSLLQGGCESTTPREILRDPKWRILGKPWRVLEYGGYKMPVFRKKISPADMERSRRLYHQHFVRIAAYCRLVEASEGARCPFGIIMFGPTYEGITVPVDKDVGRRFHNALVDFRDLLKSGHTPRPPRNEGKCRGCPLGKPDMYVPSPTYGESECGTRFHWTPPHQRWDQ